MFKTYNIIQTLWILINSDISYGIFVKIFNIYCFDIQNVADRIGKERDVIRGQNGNFLNRTAAVDRRKLWMAHQKMTFCPLIAFLSVRWVFTSLNIEYLDVNIIADWTMNQNCYRPDRFDNDFSPFSLMTLEKDHFAVCSFLLEYKKFTFKKAYTF